MDVAVVSAAAFNEIVASAEEVVLAEEVASAIKMEALVEDKEAMVMLHPLQTPRVVLAVEVGMANLMDSMTVVEVAMVVGMADVINVVV